jgi:nucleotide-binding universal stress UspA family protein
MIAPKDLVVFVEGEQGRDGRLAFAAELAERWGAHLIVTFVAGRIELTPDNTLVVGGGIEALLREHEDEVRAAEADARRFFDTLASSRPITSEWRLSADEAGESLMLHARHASLAIVGPPRRSSQAVTTLSLSESVVFASGRPSLLLPFDWPFDRIGRRIVVGWNGSREAARAVADAMPFLADADSVHLVVVSETKTRLLLGADPGADVSRHLARHGVPVVLEQRDEGEAGEVLLERARDVDADMIVMGAYGRSKISEFIFGGATRTILESAEVPVLLSR